MSLFKSILPRHEVTQSRHAVLLPHGEGGTHPQVEISQRDEAGRVSELRVTCRCGQTCSLELGYDDTGESR